MRRLSLCLLLFCVALVYSVAADPLDPAKLAEIDSAMQKAIGEHRLPGAVVWVEHGGEIYWKAYGNRSLVPTVEAMTRDTIFDVASLTKVLAGTPAVMLLVERGKVNLDAPVSTYIPEFTGDERQRSPCASLLTHTSGLPPDVSTNPKWEGTETAIRMAAAMKLETAPGTEFRYSDINFFPWAKLSRASAGCRSMNFAPRKFTARSK